MNVENENNNGAFCYIKVHENASKLNFLRRMTMENWTAYENDLIFKTYELNSQ